MTNPVIQINITGVAYDARFNLGNRISDLHNIGHTPDGVGGDEGRDLHFSNPSGSRIVVRDYQTDELIVSGNGWDNTMQALADHYQTPVQVQRDYGVTGGKSGKVLGYWAPASGEQIAQPAKIDTAPQPHDRQIPAMRAVLDAPLARDLQPGALLHLADGEFVPVLGVAVTEDRQRVVITYGDQHRAHKLTRGCNEAVLTADPATIRLTKAQTELLLAVSLGQVSYRPSNAEWAPSHARRSAMFQMGIKSSNRTLAGNALDAYGLLAYNPGKYWIVELTEPGKAWLAAHPA